MADGQAIEIKGTNPTSGGVFGQIVGTGLGMLTSSFNDARQRKLSRYLAEMNKRDQMAMAKFNQGMALEMFEKTGYGAQRKQMEAAGLNPGLMYGGAGGPGTTQGAAPSQVSSQGATPVNPGEFGMAIHSTAEMMMLKAQIENINADTKLKETEATKKAGVDTENVQAGTQNLIAKTNNEIVDNAILKYQEKIAQIEARVKDNTELDTVNAIRLANEETVEEIRSKRAEANIKTDTQEEVIKQIKTVSIEQALRIDAQKLGLIKTGADINAVNMQIKKLLQDMQINSAENVRNWEKLSVQQREVAVKETMQRIAAQATDFNTSTPEQIKQWTSIITSLIPLMPAMPKAPIGFK